MSEQNNDNIEITKSDTAVKKVSFWGKIKIRLKEFFKENIVNHKWRSIGFILIWIFPLTFLSTYFALEQVNQASTYKLTYEWWTILALFIIIVIYFKKIRQVVRDRKLEARIKGIPLNPLLHLLEGVGVVGTIALVYWVVYLMDNIDLSKLLKYIILCMCSIGVGYILYAIDDIDSTKVDN